MIHAMCEALGSIYRGRWTRGYSIATSSIQENSIMHHRIKPISKPSLHQWLKISSMCWMCLMLVQQIAIGWPTCRVRPTLGSNKWTHPSLLDGLPCRWSEVDVSCWYLVTQSGINPQAHEYRWALHPRCYPEYRIYIFTTRIKRASD